MVWSKIRITLGRSLLSIFLRHDTFRGCGGCKSSKAAEIQPGGLSEAEVEVTPFRKQPPAFIMS